MRGFLYFVLHLIKNDDWPKAYSYHAAKWYRKKNIVKKKISYNEQLMYSRNPTPAQSTTKFRLYDFILNAYVKNTV